MFLSDCAACFCFHREEQDYTPSEMEQSQQMQPVIPEEEKEETEQQEAEQTDLGNPFSDF